MAWVVSSIRDSLLGWLVGSAPAPQALPTEPARQAMLNLALWDGMGLNEAEHLLLLARIRYARDLDTLWYLRPELMRALAAKHGELLARERVNGLAGYFGVQPVAPTPGRSAGLLGR